MEKKDYIKQGKRNRKKGQDYELLVCKIINKELKTDFQRTPGSGGMHWKGDILNLGNKSTMNTIHFEIKNVQKLSIVKWLEQSYSDAPIGKMPTVISKIPRVFNTQENYRKKIQHIITMDLMDFIELIKIIDEGEFFKKEIKEVPTEDENKSKTNNKLYTIMKKKYEKDKKEREKRWNTKRQKKY